MLFPEEQSMLYNKQPETTQQSNLLQVFPLVSERSPVEHSRLPLFQRQERPNLVHKSPFNCKAGIVNCFSNARSAASLEIRAILTQLQDGKHNLI